MNYLSRTALYRLYRITYDVLWGVPSRSAPWSSAAGWQRCPGHTWSTSTTQTSPWIWSTGQKYNIREKCSQGWGGSVGCFRWRVTAVLHRHQVSARDPLHKINNIYQHYIVTKYQSEILSTRSTISTSIISDEMPTAPATSLAQSQVTTDPSNDNHQH